MRRWRLAKCDNRTGIEIPIVPPEPHRIYWTLDGAVSEAERLNAGLRNLHSRWRYVPRVR